MDINTIITGELMDEKTSIPFAQVCHMYHLSEEVLIELLEHGLFHDITPPVERIHFNSFMLSRVRSACRLQEDLGVNLQGVILALELRDELEQIRNELSILKRHLDNM